MARHRRRDPEDALIRHVMAKRRLPKARVIAILKSRGLIRQSGRHLEPTAKGARAIAKVRRKRRARRA